MAMKAPGYSNCAALWQMNDRYAWKKLANLPEGRSQHCFEELGGILYAACGLYQPDYPNHHKNTLYAYNPANNTWADKNPGGDVPAIRQSAIMRAVNGKLYLIGGLNSVTPTYYKDVHEYDPIGNTWTQKTDAPSAREDMASAVVNNKIYVLGGIKVGAFIARKIVEVYDPAEDSWEVLDDMPDARCLGDFGCTCNNKIYIISSTNDVSEYGTLNPTKRVDEFNPATGEWIRKADIPTARCYKEADAIGDRIFVVSGTEINITDYKDENEFLDVPDNTWHTHAPLPYAARGVAQCMYNDKIYLCGGNVQASNDYLYVFDPTIPPTFSGEKNVVDVMGNNDGTAQRDVEILTVEDAGDRGLIFDSGESDYLSCAHHSSLNMPNFVAINVWFKTSDNSRMSIIDKGYTDYELAIEDSATRILMWFGNSGGSKVGLITYPVPLADNARHHLLVQCFKSTGLVKLWVDGDYIGSHNPGASTGNLERALRIGERAGQTQLFNGRLYSVIIFSVELSDNEIAWLWNGGDGRENLSIASPLVGGSLAKGRKGLVR